MNYRLFLLLGLLAPLVFSAAAIGLSLMVSDYSHISQTVSEIGKQGSPVELLWKLSNLLVALFILGLAWGLYCVAQSQTFSKVPAYFVAYFAVVSGDMAIFESPHPLHNLFGLSMILGYMAPLSLAVSWRRKEQVIPLIRFSWVVGLLILVSIALNLSPLFFRDLYPLQYYGLVQRSLLVLFYGVWCPVVALYFYRRA